MSELAQNLKRLRAAQGLSQKALASKAGVAQSTIANIEAGNTATARYLANIARSLNVSPGDLDPTFTGLGSVENRPNMRDETPLVPKWISQTDKLPVFSTKSPSRPPFDKKENPIYEVSSIEALKYSPQSYAILVSWALMEPEFRSGDLLYINPDLPPMEDTTCLFYSGNDLLAFHIGRLIRSDEETWTIAVWNIEGSKKEFNLLVSEWPVCHRVVAKLYRD